MKTILAALIVFVALSAQGQEPFVVLGANSFVKTPEGFTLPLRPRDCLPFNGKSESGAWVSFSIAGMKGSIPWHDAQIVAATPKHREAYRAVVERLKKDYTAAVAKREAARQRAADQAQDRAEREAIAREEFMRMRLLSELQDIATQLEILNRRRR